MFLVEPNFLHQIDICEVSSVVFKANLFGNPKPYTNDKKSTEIQKRTKSRMLPNLEIKTLYEGNILIKITYVSDTSQNIFITLRQGKWDALYV